MQRSDGVFFHVEGGPAWGNEVTGCFGLGASLCVKSLEVEGHLSARVDITKTWTKDQYHSDSATLTYNFDYTTSHDAAVAGIMSDMFLTPSLNVKFSISALIGFNASTCSATYQDIITWSLDSDKNVPVPEPFLLTLSFFSHHFLNALVDILVALSR